MTTPYHLPIRLELHKSQVNLGGMGYTKLLVVIDP